ncbi:SAG1250 family conjugative relaxase [Streptococcus orisratti]|nr:SAG1250 family conjugative relaxase [Streptococcus orisratti]
MVITKHFATHGKKYRKSLIKYILNPEKTDNLKLVTDFGMSNYLDFPTYEEMVEMYHANFTSNDALYDSRNDRQEKRQQKILAHHIIQSFSPEDKLTPEEINRIGYETVKELTGGQFRFIVSTHIDQDHIHNHILINSVDLNSDKKLKWDYALERNLRMISDRISKIAGAKIIENRYSYRDYQVYKSSNHKFELKQRLYFLMEHSTTYEDFREKAEQLHIKLDFTRKHSRFFMTDRDMKQSIRGNKLSKRDLYDEFFFKTTFAKREIENKIEFLLPYAQDLDHFKEMAQKLKLFVETKQKNIIFRLKDYEQDIAFPNHKISNKHLYDMAYFKEQFHNREKNTLQEPDDLPALYKNFQEQSYKDFVKLENIESAYKEYQTSRDAVHEFEIEVTPEQIEKVVDEGLYIKVSFGIKNSGLVFIPNYQMEISNEDDNPAYKVYIRETSPYFVYNTQTSEKNHYIKGRTLIRQLTDDNQTIPYRKVNLKTLKEKIADINLLLELTTTNQSFLEVKDQLVQEIAELDLKLQESQEKIATLNKMAEVTINLKSDNHESRKLAKFDFSKMNMTESVLFEHVNEEIKTLQEELAQYLEKYEKRVRTFESFIELLNANNFYYEGENPKYFRFL